jgi:hypothetical protein
MRGEDLVRRAVLDLADTCYEAGSTSSTRLPNVGSIVAVFGLCRFQLGASHLGSDLIVDLLESLFGGVRFHLKKAKA